VVDAFLPCTLFFPNRTSRNNTYHGIACTHCSISLGVVIFLILKTGLMAVSETTLNETEHTPIGVTGSAHCLGVPGGFKVERGHWIPGLYC
jgi:hypothetical protein